MDLKNLLDKLGKGLIEGGGLNWGEGLFISGYFPMGA